MFDEKKKGKSGINLDLPTNVTRGYPIFELFHGGFEEINVLIFGGSSPVRFYLIGVKIMSNKGYNFKLT